MYVCSAPPGWDGVAMLAPPGRKVGDGERWLRRGPLGSTPRVSATLSHAFSHYPAGEVGRGHAALRKPRPEYQA